MAASNTAGPIVRGDVHPGRLQTMSDPPSGPSAVNAIDAPSGETTTLAPSASFVGVPPSIGTIQIDTVPPSKRGVEHRPIVWRDHHLRGGDPGDESGDPATAGVRVHRDFERVVGGCRDEHDRAAVAGDAAE